MGTYGNFWNDEMLNLDPLFSPEDIEALVQIPDEDVNKLLEVISGINLTVPPLTELMKENPILATAIAEVSRRAQVSGAFPVKGHYMSMVFSLMAFAALLGYQRGLDDATAKGFEW